MSGNVSIRNGGNHLFVDYAKGICVIGVVMMYSTISTGLNMGGEGFLHPVVEFARPFRIPGLLFLSGMFMERALKLPVTDYFDRKVVHFAYFYGLCAVIHFLAGSTDLMIRGDYTVLRDFILAPIQPFSTLWFIYMLPVFFLAGRLFRNVPVPLVFATAALLETARIQTGWTVVDDFAGKWVYFVAGAMLAPAVFARTSQIVSYPAWTACALLAFALTDAVLTGTILSDGTRLSTTPGLSLVLGLTGAAAVIAVSALLARFRVASWLAFCGQRSLIIYLAFFLPMTAIGGALVSSGLVTDIGVASCLVTMAGVGGALLIEQASRKTSLRVLFQRPDSFRLSIPQMTPYSLSQRSTTVFLRAQVFEQILVRSDDHFPANANAPEAQARAAG